MILFRLLAVAFLAAIAVGSLIPVEAVPTTSVSDKAQHLLAYAALAVLCRLGWPRAWLWPLVIVMIAGGLIELLQGLMDLGRQAELPDLVANLAGAITGWSLAALCLRRRRRSS